MPNLEELLKMPRWGKQEHNWNRLTTGKVLFQALSEAVRNGSIGEAGKWAEEWKSFVDSSDTEQEQKQRHRQWLTILKLIWCAGQAATQPDFYLTEIDRVRFAIEDLPNFIQEDKEWAWVCIRTFIGMETRQVDVPVVLLEAKEGDKKEKGSLAILHLEVIDRGAGQIAHHPDHIFCTYMDDNFRSSIEDAWFSARDFLKKEGKEILYDARWQLLRDGEPLSMPRGRSASGAAALGFYHALRGTIPDEEIIVLAQVDQKGRLQGVDGVPEKVSAIIEDGRFDTIVVASEENQYQTKSTLKKQQLKASLKRLFISFLQTCFGLKKWDHQKQLHMELYISYTIDNLITIRSQFRKDLISYFKRIEKELTRNPLFERFGLTLDDLRIPLKGLPYDPAKDVEDRSAREHFRETAQNVKGGDDTERDKDKYAFRRIRFEKDKELSRRREQLDELESRLTMGVLLGDPGSGKTEWLKNRVCTAARETRKRLEDCEIKLKDLCFPVYLYLRDISETLKNKNELAEFLVHKGCMGSSLDMPPAKQVSSAMLKILSESHEMSNRMTQWIWGRMSLLQGAVNGTPPLICLDAWDEVRSGQKDLSDCLKAFSQQRKARIFLTSRIIGYNHFLPVENKSEGPCRELEICPFECDETETFVKQFYKDIPDIGNKILAELHDKASISGMMQNPLLATLLCMAFHPKTDHSPQGFPVRRSEVYHQVLEGLLGKWILVNKSDPAELELIPPKIELLEEIAFHFFPDEVINQNHLYDFLWNEKIKDKEKSGYINNLPEGHPIKQMLKDRGMRILKDLCKDGIIVPTGGMDTPNYMFLHLTFQEYLTASALERKAKNEGWQSIAHIVDKKAWDPDWQEVIILLAGKLKDPISLLELLSDKEKDDYFRHRLAVAALCLPEIKSAKPTIQTVMDRITTEYFSLWLEHRKYRTRDVIPYLTKGLSALGQANARICATYFGTSSTHKAFSHTLYNLISERKEGLPLLDCLSELLRNKDRNIQKIAAEAVRGLGSSAARPDILDSIVELLRNGDSSVRLAAAQAVGDLGGAAARSDILDCIVDLLRSRSVVSCWAVRGLGSGAARLEFLDRIVDLLRDKDREIPYTTLIAMRYLGSGAARPEFLDRIVALLRDEDRSVPYAALLTVLGFVGVTINPEYLDRIAEMLRDEDNLIRYAAAMAVKGLGSGAACPEFLDRIVDLLRDKDRDVQKAAAEAVGDLGGAAARPDILDSIAELLRDKDLYLQIAAAKAVGGLGSAAARSDILDSIAEMLRQVDVSWSTSLLGVHEAAAKAVRGLGGAAARPEFLDQLVEMLLDRDDVCIAALKVLKAMGSSAARLDILDRLAEMLRDGNRYLQTTAAEAVGGLGSAAARSDILDSIAEMLRHKDQGVRDAAAEAVGGLGSATARPDILDSIAEMLRSYEDRNARYVGAPNYFGRAAAFACKQLSSQGVRIFKTQKGNFEAKTVQQLSQD